jgi:hypothetical protein
MQFRDYFFSLTPPEREQYAARAGTSVDYIRMHLISSPPRKIPRRKLLDALIEATEGKVSRKEMLRHIYPPEQQSEVVQESA